MGVSEQDYGASFELYQVKGKAHEWRISWRFYDGLVGSTGTYTTDIGIILDEHLVEELAAGLLEHLSDYLW